MQFPVETSGGNCVPELQSRTGCGFRLRSSAESASRNLGLEWDVLSGWDRMRKAHPILKAHSGTGFPVGLQAESTSRFSESTKLKFAKRQLGAPPPRRQSHDDTLPLPAHRQLRGRQNSARHRSRPKQLRDSHAPPAYPSRRAYRGCRHPRQDASCYLP